MINLRIPGDPVEHVESLVGLLGPLGDHQYWRALTAVMVSEHGMLVYTGSRDGEDWNLSNWFGLLNDRERFYAGREHGELIRALYVGHEIAHLIMPTEHLAQRSQFADAFDLSERLASYETEFRVYDDIPELENLVPFRPLLARWLRERGVDLSDYSALMSWRDAVVAQPGLLARDLESEAVRLASYGDNVGWAQQYWDRLWDIGWWQAGFASHERTRIELDGYRDQVLALGEREVDEELWRIRVVDSVRRAWLLCGRGDPGAIAFGDLIEAAAQLNGSALATSDTPKRFEH
jgi:hypothetical protein